MSEIKGPIARRELKYGDDVIVVTIDKPEEDEADFRCRYLLDSGNKRRLSYAMGVDSVQALQLAMKKINSDLLAIGKETGVPVTWLDGAPGENGFSV